MSQMKTTMRLTMVALVAGALTLPGLALARGHAGDGKRCGHERITTSRAGMVTGTAMGATTGTWW